MPCCHVCICHPSTCHAFYHLPFKPTTFLYYHYLPPTPYLDVLTLHTTLTQTLQFCLPTQHYPTPCHAGIKNPLPTCLADLYHCHLLPPVVYYCCLHALPATAMPAACCHFLLPHCVHCDTHAIVICPDTLPAHYLAPLLLLPCMPVIVDPYRH